MNLVAASTLIGMSFGLGLTLILAGVRPTRTRLSDALEALGAGVTSAGTLPVSGAHRSAGQRFGDGVGAQAARWGMQTPTKDLALLGVSVSTYWAQRALSALLGLAVPLLVSAVWFLVAGRALPLVVPAWLGLMSAAALWFLAAHNISSRAARARREMSVAAVAYLRLVAIRRLASTGVSTAMESAAQVSQAWMFRRVHEALMLARISGISPWEALHQLGDRLDLHELHEIADITSQAGQGAAIASNLTARAASLRDRQLNDLVAAAGTRTTMMTGPLVLMAVTFIAALLVPAAAAILNPG